MDYDYAVVGGGPAGCVAARSASLRGKVALFEEHKKQPVHCAGLISASGFKKIGVKKGDFVLNEIHGARFYSPLGASMEVRTRNVKAYVVDRSLFDQHLMDRALTKGVDLINSRVSSIKKNNLIASRKNYSANKFILASGVDYSLHKKLKLNYPNQFLYGAQYDMKIDSDLDMVELHFVVPEFFAWIIPLGDKARIGLCTNSNPTPHLNNFIKKLSKEGRIKNKRVSNKSYGIIPFYNPKLRTQYKNINLVGDAAGQVKATTGGGVVMGALAAKHAYSNNYESKWRDEIGLELRLHHNLYRFVHKLSPQNLDRLLETTSSGAGSLERYGDMDYASKTLKGLIRNPRFTFNLLLNMPSFVLDLI